MSTLLEISKSLPSAVKAALKAGKKPSDMYLQLGERVQAHQLGQVASRHYARNTGHGWQVAQNGARARASSRTGWTGERGFGKPKAPDLSTPSSRLQTIGRYNERARALGYAEKPTSRPGA